MRLVEAAEHGEETIPVGEDGSPLDVRVVVEPAHGLVYRRCTEVLREDQLSLAQIGMERIVRPPPMPDHTLGRDGDACPGATVRDFGDQEGVTGDGESPLVKCGFEHGQCLFGELTQSCGRSIGGRLEHALQVLPL